MAANEELIQATAHEVFSLIPEQKPSREERRQNELIEWAAADEAFKVELLRFIDVFPALGDRAEIIRHVQEHFGRAGVSVPKGWRWGVRFSGGHTPVAPFARGVLRRQVRAYADRFIVGRDGPQAMPKLRRLHESGTAFTVDALGEATVSEIEARAYQQTYLDLLDVLISETATWPSRKIIDEASWGPLPRVNLSIKITGLYSQIDPVDFQGSLNAVKDRLRPIFRKAMAGGTAISIDLEQYPFRDLAFAVYTSLLDEEEFAGYHDAGIALQAYLRDSDRDLAQLIDWARVRRRPVNLRLVKGAYWDYEHVLAAQKNWPPPVFTHKPDTDAMYERLAREMLEHPDQVRPEFASHNVRSLAMVIATARQLGLPENGFEIQMLHGMGDPVKAALRSMGLRLREYTPVGELIPGMAFLVRRLLENTAGESFLRRRFIEKVDVTELVGPPKTSDEYGRPQPRAHVVHPTDPQGPRAFRNHPQIDFSRIENRAAYKAALAAVRGRLPSHHPLRIGGRSIETTGSLTSVNPAKPDEVIGTTGYGGRAEAEAAVAAAQRALYEWRDTAPQARAAVLFRAAELMRRESLELAALVTLEAGKPRREAGADVDEAIDFLEYYGREMLRLGQPRRMGRVPGEHNLYFYQPRGVALVIAPWNFPLAIITGMTSAALVAGNTVIVKPAGPTPVIAAHLVRLLEAAGAPAGAVNYLPCPGGEVGDFLVRHPDIDLIAFTGSMDVGLRILNQAAQNPGRAGIKKVIAEMGGKNAIIVDTDADLDVAVTEIVASAFHYAGQKCSAASRVIVLDRVYETFVARLAEATSSLAVGPAEDPASRVGPVITADAKASIDRYIEIAAQEGRRVVGSGAPDGGWPGGGYFVAPHVFADVKPDATIAQEEIFGPVLAVIRAADIDAAISIANNVKYALTGGLMSRSPATIARVRRDLRVGNLYINRGITGALVERQPFGGFKYSGVGSKAGGPDYLLQFLEPRVITENTMRRGFAPPDELLGI
jgi:RHH-type proline utilization regulon transcriptional repressor/proline dehydrogenase/delta 1-pyrroline-5-carboxylate dehydrogenase